MDEKQLLTRRESLKRLIQLSGGAVVSSTMGWISDSPGALWAMEGKRRFLVEATSREGGDSVKRLLRRTLEAAGGMKAFVKRGDVVVIKPNISWARAPHLAATTNPTLLEGVVELCQDAGARRIRIADNTIHDARRCFAISGAGEVARKTGAELVHPRSSMMREMQIHGDRLDKWPVFIPFIETDRIINLPVAKHHALSSVTLGMKGWIGAVGGSRHLLHQDIHKTVVDLAQFFTPTVTLIDAIRIMVRNGPSGGSAADVVEKNTLILSDDPVAADARGAALFGHHPGDIGFIRLGEKRGLGSSNMETLDYKRVVL